jgi:hypothetical protein
VILGLLYVNSVTPGEARDARYPAAKPPRHCFQGENKYSSSGGITNESLITGLRATAHASVREREKPLSAISYEVQSVSSWPFAMAASARGTSTKMVPRLSAITPCLAQI